MRREILCLASKGVRLSAFVFIVLIMPLLFCSSPDSGGDMNTLPDIDANLLFLYYDDLEAAKEFYSEIIGLEQVLDYGFAAVYRISQTSYVGLVNGTEGMHTTDKPKTVTLSFITQEIDDWYHYLVEQGVEMRGEVKNATRHDTRGFVAYDPEGYFLEFETFLVGEENEKLNAALAKTEAMYRPAGEGGKRPENLGFEGNVIWLYYNDIPAIQKFYEEQFGFELLVDQGFAKVYSSSPTCFIGLVDGAHGLHKFTEEKAVIVSFITDEIDTWYEHLISQGIEMQIRLSDPDREGIRTFHMLDPGKYFLEFDYFKSDDERNLKLIEALNSGKSPR